jgi:cytochrome c oxidase subunit 2
MPVVLQFPGAQSVHQPAGPHALLIDRLGHLLYWTSAAVFVLVVAALLWAAFHRRRPEESSRDPARERRMTIAVATASAATIAVLFLCTLATYATGRELTAPPGGKPLQIRVTGHQWWWSIEYRDSIPIDWVTTANEIHLPVGRPAVFELSTQDVNHSFWLPDLGPKRDLIAGQETSIWYRADSAGIYRGQCAEFCGYQHAKMALTLVAEPPDSFAAWLTRQRQAASPPTDALARRGLEVFLGSTCVTCHTITGTPAGGRVGPDLTHLASRRTIAAGTLPNPRGNLAGWILDPQGIKPGAKMPPTRLDPADLQALLTYLETLR